MSNACRSHAAGPPAHESVADILIRFHQRFLARYGDDLSTEERLALQSILLCRTQPMGGRSYHCEHCQSDHFAWHSCNHRLCPRCGAADTAQWVGTKLENRLPVDHFMVTFTLPEQLRRLCRYHPEVFYRLFFTCAAQAIKDVLKQPRHLGGQCGFFGMLQSWTQDLRLHPHIHFVVPAIGIDKDGRVKRPRNPKWLAYGEVFASRLKTLLLKAIEKQGMLPVDRIRSLWGIDWNCDVENFGSGENSIKYLGAYLFKGPISNSRILSSDEHSVRISIKDRKSGKRHPLQVDGVEFVRRYLQHALPSGFHRLRYYGFLHCRSRQKLEAIREQLGVERREVDNHPPEPIEPKPMLCPRCRQPMLFIGHQSRAPPWERSIARIWRTQTAA